ncbi:integral membrane protein [Cadophora sp. MPI-SDFR-AT-0126]|nr:integral membrane protein [Leotiomycetes sp. MPI-SDFR-AT-0126]
MKVDGILIIVCCGLLRIGTVTAQGLALADTPPCALECVAKALPSSALSDNVPLEDVICPNVKLLSTLSTCVQISCPFQDQITVSEIQKELCRGIPIESRSTEIILLVAILSGITFPVAGLKFYTRWSMSRRLDWDDYAALVATLFMAGLAALEIASAKLGLGQHYWTVSVLKGVLILKFYYVVQMFYIFVQVTAKMSLLLLYIRVFPRTRTALLSKVGIGFLILHGMVYLFLVIFQCTPIAFIWDRSLTGKCLNLNVIGYSGAAASILEDFFILILPIIEIKALQLGRGKKWNLFLMFSIGSFACVTSIVRLKFLSDFTNSFDATWDQTDVVKWSLIEEFVAVLCACIPSLRAFLIQKFRMLNSSVRTIAKSKNASQVRSGAQRLDDHDETGSYPLHNITKTVGVSFEEKDLDGNDLERQGSTTAIYATERGRI